MGQIVNSSKQSGKIGVKRWIHLPGDHVSAHITEQELIQIRSEMENQKLREDMGGFSS